MKLFRGCRTSELHPRSDKDIEVSPLSNPILPRNSLFQSLSTCHKEQKSRCDTMTNFSEKANQIVGKVLCCCWIFKKPLEGKLNQSTRVRNAMFLILINYLMS
jgi:hypothetical protein